MTMNHPLHPDLFCSPRQLLLIPAPSPQLCPLHLSQCVPHITHLVPELLPWFQYSEQKELLSQALSLLRGPMGNLTSSFKLPTHTGRLSGVKRKALPSPVGLQLGMYSWFSHWLSHLLGIVLAWRLKSLVPYNKNTSVKWKWRRWG